MENKAYGLKASSVSPKGEFTGRASVYFTDDGAPFVDSDGDIIAPGAFTQTIKKNGGATKILVQHKAEAVVGLGSLRDTPTALLIDGKLELELPEARDAYTRLKANLIDGLSIGFSSIKEEFVRGARLIKEIELFEVSLVTWGANALARVESVKQRGDEAELRSILGALKSANVAYRTAKDQEDARALRDVLTGLRLTRIGINLDRLINSL